MSKIIDDMAMKLGKSIHSTLKTREDLVFSVEKICWSHKNVYKYEITSNHDLSSLREMVDFLIAVKGVENIRLKDKTLSFYHHEYL